jgi:hypothetical protein
MELASKCMEQRMRALAEQENTDVLEYVYESQDRGADAVMCVKMFELVAERRRSLGPEVSDEQAAQALRTASADVRDFAKNFPGIFQNAIDLAGAPRHLAMLKQLARIRKEVEQRAMSEAEANVHATRVILEKTMRAPTEKEKAEHARAATAAPPCSAS